MEFFVLFIVFIVWLASGFYCGAVADSKGHNGAAWAFGGFFFGFIALIAVAGLPDRKLRKYIRLIGEKQKAIKVVKESVEQSVAEPVEQSFEQSFELIDGNTKISFSMPKDSTKEEVYKKLVDAVEAEDCRLEKYNVTSYILDIDNWGKQFIVNSEKKTRLIVLVGKDKGNNIIWSGRI